MNRDSPALQLLKKHLAALTPGAIADIDKLAALLDGCWHQLDGACARHEREQARAHGSGALGATAIKLHHRAPRCDGGGFEPRRAAALARRSRPLRGELRQGSRLRQLLPRAQGVKAEPIAAALAEAISARQANNRLKWLHDGTVRVVLAKVFLYGSGYRQTIAGRRKRFRAALIALLAARGWREVRRDIYSRETPNG